MDLPWCAELSDYKMLKETEVASCNGEQPKLKNVRYKLVAKSLGYVSRVCFIGNDSGNTLLRGGP